MNQENEAWLSMEDLRPTQMISKEFLCIVREPSIVGKYGRMPDTLQIEFDNGLNAGTDEGVNLALLVLDRWRFANLTREAQIKELKTLIENEAWGEERGFYPYVYSRDLADLVLPEGVDRQTWLHQVSPFPPNGFVSLLPRDIVRE